MREMEGMPFNGANVADKFGKMAAGLTTLSDIVKEILEKWK